ncbi:aldose epimerase family protein [Mycolicibacterium sp.]|uniref:aldose epimerase family protein n=1 Tax=Mycolicibacterium sp. TaxID=2320850 RepID=UPI003D0B4F9E
MIETRTVDGFEVQLITLTDGAYRAVLTDLGARLLELHVPGRDGATDDIVLQRRTFEEMSRDDTYMGATAGRFANRIRQGRLTIDGTPVQLSINEGRNHLHGGTRGFDRKIWAVERPAPSEVTFWRISPAGEEGYPGALTTRVRYRLEEGALVIDITATTDAPTVANIVHHSYFNLGGHDAGTILDHVLEVRAAHYLPVDRELLPTGEIAAVEGTPFDFRTATPIGENVARVGNTGYDHNWVLDGSGVRPVLVVTDPASGRRLTLSTNQPGVQVYTGGYLAGVTGKAPMATYPAFAGLALETQTFPDAVNQPHFPSAALRPGETYHNAMRFDFSVV